MSLRAPACRRGGRSTIPATRGAVALALHRPVGLPSGVQRTKSSLTKERTMHPAVRIFLALVLSLGFSVSAVHAQAKQDLTIALPGLATETLDPVVQGHNVKYYLSMMFDYL